MLYRASLKENTPDDFHRLCDNKGPTIILIETTKGKRFGGYTSLDWDSSSEWKNDLEEFLFSLDNDKKYEVIPNSSYKVYSNRGFGLWFGYNGNIGLAYDKKFLLEMKLIEKISLVNVMLQLLKMKYQEGRLLIFVKWRFIKY